eukprot:3890207-Rhodomonas_salina.3
MEAGQASGAVAVAVAGTEQTRSPHHTERSKSYTLEQQTVPGLTATAALLHRRQQSHAYAEWALETLCRHLARWALPSS